MTLVLTSPPGMEFLFILYLFYFDDFPQVEEREELEESSRSNNFESGGDGFSLTVDGMSNSIAMSFQWLDKVHIHIHIYIDS